MSSRPPNQWRSLSFDLMLVAIGAVGLGWTASRELYLGAVIYTLLALAGLVDFERGYRRDRYAARKWRELRWNSWKTLEAGYLAEIYKTVPPSHPDYSNRIAEAQKRAMAEVSERYGPIT